MELRQIEREQVYFEFRGCVINFYVFFGTMWVCMRCLDSHLIDQIFLNMSLDVIALT